MSHLKYAYFRRDKKATVARRMGTRQATVLHHRKLAEPKIYFPPYVAKQSPALCCDYHGQQLKRTSVLLQGLQRETQVSWSFWSVRNVFKILKDRRRFGSGSVMLLSLYAQWLGSWTGKVQISAVWYHILYIWLHFWGVSSWKYINTLVWLWLSCNLLHLAVFLTGGFRSDFRWR